MKKASLLVAFLAFLILPALSQDQPIRIGVKLGYPNFLGLNAEYATPLLGGRLAPSVDFSYLPTRDFGDNLNASFRYFELGTNIYIIRPGKGLYLNLGYGRFGFKGTATETLDFGPPVGVAEGEGNAKLGLNRFNVKLGTKFGGRVYFRSEFGWALGIGDSSLDVDYTATGSGVTVTESESFDIPKLIAGGPLVNVGFGIGF